MEGRGFEENRSVCGPSYFETKGKRSRTSETGYGEFNNEDKAGAGSNGGKAAKAYNRLQSSAHRFIRTQTNLSLARLQLAGGPHVQSSCVDMAIESLSELERDYLDDSK
jgi:hypothetical protein